MTGPMTARETGRDRTDRVRIPADVDRPDRVLAGLTARQLAILTVPGLGLWLGYVSVGERVGLVPFAVVAFPVAAASVALALGRRDGVGLDRLVLAAIAQARAPRRRVPAPEGVPPPHSWVAASPGPAPAPLRLPARALRPDGVVDLGREGAAVLVSCAPLNFTLRTPAEQRALVAAFGRYLNSLTAGVQVLVRADRVDLEPAAARLREDAGGLPHPALEAAARAHAEFLSDLASRRDLLSRRVLLVVREPHPPSASPGRDDGDAAARAARRGEEAARALAPAGIGAGVLDGPAAAAELAAACTPAGRPRPAVQATPGAIITSPREGS